ncbi:MAG TPA: hypothetical protein VMU89_23705 [Thermomicrobiaceae bacterium]|nr:hypothetical protein [Thermomicrobiaceae bacterium]
MEAARVDYQFEGAARTRASGRQHTGVAAATCVAAALSVAGAMIHAYMMPQHFAEWWGYGVFFLISTLAQGVGAIALAGWPRRSLFLVVVAGNLLILIVWALSRTVGTPLFGPGAGEVEPIGLLDVVCAVVEGLTVVLLAVLAVVPEADGEPAAGA